MPADATGTYLSEEDNAVTPIMSAIQKLNIIEVRAVVVAILVFAAVAMCGAQSKTRDVDSQIEAMRADLRAEKTEIVTNAMDFTPKESKIFWPVYRRYEAELTELNDNRVALMREYAAKYGKMTEDDAKAILRRALEFDADRAELKKVYADEFQKAGLPASTTAKFFQLEHRLDMVVDLKLASELPSLLVEKRAKK